MPTCIFCLTEHEELTREHVFEAALGGTLEVPNASCSKCNNGFSGKFERNIADCFLHFRRMFGIPDRTGALPVVEVTANIGGELLPAKLLPDGTVQLRPKTTVIRNDEGVVREVIHEHATDRLREQLRKQAEKPGWEYIEETSPGKSGEASFGGHLDFLTSPEALRMATKAAYTTLAYKAGLPFVRSDAFLESRKFILIGEGRTAARIFTNDRFLAYFQQRPYQHSVIVAGQNTKHTVEAVVRLFGSLCWFVTLSDDYHGADFSYTLALDAREGKVVRAFVTGLETEFNQIEDISTATDTVWDNQMVSGRSFLSSVQEADRAYQQREGSNSEEVPL